MGEREKRETIKIIKAPCENCGQRELRKDQASGQSFICSVNVVASYQDLCSVLLAIGLPAQA